jgi:hypothetical protein
MVIHLREFNVVVRHALALLKALGTGITQDRCCLCCGAGAAALGTGVAKVR